MKSHVAAALLSASVSSIAESSVVDYMAPPDFAQIRSELDDDGGFHCGPTSAADGLQWLANNGWPLLSPLTVTDDAADGSQGQAPVGSAPWVIQQWTDITDYIDSIGIEMDTDALDGTSAAKLIDGLEEILGVYEDAFYIGHYGRVADSRWSWERGGDLDTALDRLALGNVVLANVGFYHHPDGLRCGGHWMCLMGFEVVAPFAERYVRLKDPGRDSRTVSTHLVTTETVWLEEDGDIGGDGNDRDVVEITVDSWNWERSISSSNADADCPLGNNRYGYQDNIVYFGETLVRWIDPDLFTIQSWQLGRDLFGPLHDFKVWDYAMLWDLNVIIYVDRPTGQLFSYDLILNVSTPIELNIQLDNLRRVRVAPDGTMLLINVVNEAARLGTVVSPQGAVLGQFSLSNRLDAVWWRGTDDLAAGFLVADGANLLHVQPEAGATLLTQIPVEAGALPKLAVDDVNHILYITSPGAASVQRLDLTTLVLESPLPMQAPVSGVATGGAGWLYVPLVNTGAAGSTFVFRDGQFQRVITQPFSANLSVDQPPFRSPNQNPEQTDWPFDFGDLDHDGSIGIGDLLVILDEWGSGSGGEADLDGDGLIAIGDVLALLGMWG